MRSNRSGQLSDVQLRALAARYVWWRPPDETLSEPVALLRSVLKAGTAEDYVLVRGHYGEPALIEALLSAPPGAIDDRSWRFWRRRFGLPDTPPPRRQLG
jgi:hypothetical protein